MALLTPSTFYQDRESWTETNFDDVVARAVGMNNPVTLYRTTTMLWSVAKDDVLDHAYVSGVFDGKYDGVEHLPGNWCFL